ncbi:5'-3' exonuclease H3TH domain-containing protein [Patescibacteria group bacterium]
MDKLVLVDGFAILHRAFHAMPPLTNKKGQMTNAIYGFVSMLLRIIQDLDPTHIIVCMDEKEPTFRHKAFKTYQAQRPKMDKSLESQIEKTKEVIKAFRIPTSSKKGYEADDVIGTLSERFKKKIDVVIVTGDRDILQLVDNKVKVFMPIAGLSNGKLYGEEETLERIGVIPDLIPDFKALVGDPSDNYFGVTGVGPKTAIKLLDEYKNVDGVYKNIKKINPKLAEKLIKDKKSAFMSYKLATIVKNVPIKLNLEDAGKWDLDNNEVLNLFSDLGFKTLTERIKKFGRKKDLERQMNLL